MDSMIARRYQVLSLLTFGIAIFLFKPRVATFYDPIARDPALPNNVIGIELGGDFSRVGIYRNNSFEIIPDERGRTAIPTYVAFLDSPGKTPLVGFEAREQAKENVKNTIYDLKLLLGQSSSNPALQKTFKALKYDVMLDSNEHPMIKINQNSKPTFYRPEEIQSLMIGRLKSMAETYLNTTITHAAIAVPSDFNDHQRLALKNSASLAGINVQSLVNETFAIGVAYRVDLRPCDADFGRYECRYVVYAGKERGEIELAAFWSDDGLFEILGSVKSSGEDRTMNDLEETLTDIPGREIVLSDPNNNIMQSQETGTKKLQDLLSQLLANSNTTKEAIDGIIISLSKLPHQPLPALAHIKTVLQSYFPNTEILTPPGYLNFKYDEAILCGTAKQGHMLSDECPTTGPSVSFFSALSLGFELSDGAFLRVVRRGELLPLRAKRLISTSIPNQEKVTIRLFEGEREIASNNKFLGVVDFDLDEKSARQKLEITFDLSEDQVLVVTVRLDAWDGLEVGRLVVPVRALRYKQGEIEEIVLVGEKFHDEDVQWLREGKAKVLNGVEQRESGNVSD